MIVADTNLLAYAFIEGEFTADARAVLDKDPEWHAPVWWRSEMLNVLAQAVHSGMLTPVQAHTVFELATAHMSTREHVPPETAVLETAVRFRISAYDAQFVATALDLGVPLVTSDKGLLKACPQIAVSPRRFVEGS